MYNKKSSECIFRITVFRTSIPIVWPGEKSSPWMKIPEEKNMFTWISKLKLLWIAERTSVGLGVYSDAVCPGTFTNVATLYGFSYGRHEAIWWGSAITIVCVRFVSPHLVALGLAITKLVSKLSTALSDLCCALCKKKEAQRMPWPDCLHDGDRDFANGYRRRHQT
jgi:hypothetical protein